MNQEAFLTISEASRILGVSDAALRQWTDEGKIKAFVTPGGHRRYARTELKRFISSQPKMLGIKDLAVELEDAAQMLRETSKTSLDSSSWYDVLHEDSRAQLAHLGRQLLNLIIKYITEPSRRDETVQQTHNVGRNFGETLARLELPLTNSVEVFLLHREPIMKATTHLMRRREAVNGRIIDAIPMVIHVMDEALVALVAAHQQHDQEIQRSDGGITG